MTSGYNVTRTTETPWPGGENSTSQIPTLCKLLRGSVRSESGRLRTRSAEISLPQGIETNSGNDLSLPAYWAGFSLLSNPW